MIKPDTIFKYMNINTQTIINIKSQTLYMSSPLNFNDPYDCSINIILNDISENEIDKIIQYYSQKDDAPQDIKAQLKMLNKNNIKEIFQSTIESTINDIKNNFLHSRGVTCFSEVNDNLLMWAHYCDGHKGICFEFFTKYQPFDKLRKVNYAPKFPYADVLSLLTGDPSSLVDNLYCTKSDNWKYEKEWRLIHKVAGTSYAYPPDALKAIYFGPKIERDILETICLIIQGQNPNVEFWNGKLNEKEFKIEFGPFDYTSHIKAKENELL